MDEAMYDEGCDTDGDKEEALPSKEEIEALVAHAENPVFNNISVTHQVIDANINSNITAVDPGLFFLISDEDIDKMKVKGLQYELKKHALTNNATSSPEIPGFAEGAYWEELSSRVLLL
eukprot:10092812-Ditylum_brightwellii.AAC.1